jgi:hypothetical protein
MFSQNRLSISGPHIPSKLHIALDPATSRADEGASSRKISRPVGIEIEMPVDFAAPPMQLHHKMLCLERLGIVFVVAFGNMILASPSRGIWACAYASSESSIDRVKRHHFLPRDWLDMDMLDRAVMRSGGHFYVREMVKWQY